MFKATTKKKESGMTALNKAKPFEIPKELVWKAWQAVKANRGAAGVDEQTIEDFERERNQGLYKIWNREPYEFWQL